LILHLALFLGTGSPACSTTLRSQNPVYAITAKAVAIIKQFSGFGPSMSLSAILILVGIMLWISVGVWDFLALELTESLFWARLAAPVIVIAILILALLLR
jgi:phosphoglycerol transferase MdoB-like AlkP superfamily enzyme